MTIPARSSYLRVVPPPAVTVAERSDDLDAFIGILNGLAIIIPAWAALATLIYWVLP